MAQHLEYGFVDTDREVEKTKANPVTKLLTKSVLMASGF
ncbi:MAG: hypothetical protein HC768_23380 [Acaryochloris sp. CRU_2_0]|nr:hypothetical protein [Acaryochloris sp. CRU_2_0]